MIELPLRGGEKPSTTDTNPHQQLDQNSPSAIHALLKARAFDFPHVDRRPSIISVPGAEALWLEEKPHHACAEAFMAGNEFAHVHPEYDGSMHMMLPPEQVSELIAKGWGEQHPLALRGVIPMTAAMVFAPRDESEIEIALKLIGVSHEFARGDWQPPRT